MRVIAHGIDIVDNQRIARMIDAHGERFIDRCFTESEQRYADQGDRRRVERYAVRFACKEAVLKAIGTGWRSGISWCEIEVVRQPSGEPVLRLTGRCAELAAERGINCWRISLSHTDACSVASVIAGVDHDVPTP